MTPTSRFVTDISWRRPAQGNVVLAGSPLTLFSLSEAGRRIAENIERGQSLTSGHESLTERLLDAGAIHPIPEPSNSEAMNTITAVIPAFVRSAEEAQHLKSLVAMCADFFAVIVVDDCSPYPLPDLGRSVVIRLSVNSGPATARNVGLQQVSTDFVAFIDLDIALSSTTVGILLPYFSDPKVALVAPRVKSFGQSNALAEYESVASVLDMGEVEARIAPATRVSYVPSAMQVCRTSAVRSVSGFNETLRFGEDVDLVWQLQSGGWRCRYQPQAVCTHLPRSTFKQFARQRMSYGESAAPLAARHPGKLAPIQLSAWQASTWISVLLGLPFVALGIAVLASVSTTRKLRKFPHLRTDAFQISLHGTMRSGLQLAQVFARTWWPIAVIASLFSQRLRVLFIACALGPTLYEWWKKRPHLDVVRFTLIKMLDNTAYGTGVWKGAIAKRKAQALLPIVKRSAPNGE